ncbi:MAG TPA: hypothetical protein VJ746_14185 [Nitrospira sp.]|nr:hypothetical protein [Nitrospira sp.]
MRIQSTDARVRRRSDFTGFHAPALYASTDGSLHPREGAPEGDIGEGVPRFNQYAGKIAQDYFDPAELVDTAARTR